MKKIIKYFFFCLHLCMWSTFNIVTLEILYFVGGVQKGSNSYSKEIARVKLNLCLCINKSKNLKCMQKTSKIFSCLHFPTGKKAIFMQTLYMYFHTDLIDFHMRKYRKLLFFSRRFSLTLWSLFGRILGWFIQRFFRFSPVKLLKIFLFICFNILNQMNV